MNLQSLKSGNIAELLEQARNASGPDRELDCDIEHWLYLSGLPHFGHLDEVPPFTASIDHALALVERLLPGWQCHMGTCGEDDMPWACITEPEDPCRDFAASAPTIHLAMIEALLKVQEAQP